MRLGIKLDKEIHCEWLCKKISDFINNQLKTHSLDASKCMLVLEIKEPLENNGDSLLPKLEYKEITG